MLVAIRIAAQAQLHRIELECDRKLVHCSIRAHRRRSRRWARACRTTSAGRDARADARISHWRICRAGRTSRSPADRRSSYCDVTVTASWRDRVERSVAICAERDALNHRRPIAQHVHLRPRQHHAHRALQRARRQHCQHHLELRAQAGTETHRPCRAFITRTSSGFSAEHAAQIMLDVLHALRLVVDRELAVRARRSRSRHRAPSGYGARSAHSIRPRAAPRLRRAPDRHRRVAWAVRTRPRTDLSEP